MISALACSKCREGDERERENEKKWGVSPQGEKPSKISGAPEKEKVLFQNCDGRSSGLRKKRVLSQKFPKRIAVDNQGWGPSGNLIIVHIGADTRA